jgi:adenine-specific DNA-methyltransferase
MDGTLERASLSPPGPVEQAELWRLETSRKLDRGQRAKLGQFLTPAGLAEFMASLFRRFPSTTRVLDAGAGVGALLAATVAEACHRSSAPTRIEACTFEIEPLLVSYLRRTCRNCRSSCEQAGVSFDARVVQEDFIQAAVDLVDPGLFAGSGGVPGFTHAILNPPYKKLHSASAARVALRRAGIETSNLYTAFVALAIKLLLPGGELVAITPRSFCNGPYFKPFRAFLLQQTNLLRLHIFESRKAAFADDEVLQENVILHVVKAEPQGRVIVSSSLGPTEAAPSSRDLAFSEVVQPGDPELFIRVVADDAGHEIAERCGRLPCSLAELNLNVSTGKVVDFRALRFLRSEPETGTGPLLYPTHLVDGGVVWPKAGKKPNALVDVPETKDLWMPSGTYVLVKRFSSKEERRRVVASVFRPSSAPGDKIGFENHLNVFHAKGRGLDPVLAKGLAAFLNSTLVDAHFRQFNGHTQVNATDLRNLRYPSRDALAKLGAELGEMLPPQRALDDRVETVLAFDRG